MLTATFTGRMEAYARQVGRVGQMKLVVLAMDSLHIGIQTPSNHDSLKRTYSSKISSNGVIYCIKLNYRENTPLIEKSIIAHG